MLDRKPLWGLACAVLAALSLAACSVPARRPSSPAWKPSSSAWKQPVSAPRLSALAAARTVNLPLVPQAAPRKRAPGFPSASGLGGQVEATSGATAAADADTDANSSATKEPNLSSDPVAAACLKCHGPFVELSKRTASYVTEWDEKANPHVLVPHDSDKIITCLDCHEQHPLPAKAGMAVKKATVNACYSCHHAETFAACADCHNE